MDIVLWPYRTFAAAYLDDVLIHSSTWLDHLFHLSEVLSGIWKAGLTANPCECHLGLTEAEYLGYCIGHWLLRLQEKKLGMTPDPPTRNRHFLQLFRRDPEVFPGQPRDIVFPRVSSQWGMPGTPPQGDILKASETDA
ncbi:hypothetical protein QTP70_016577 [Hemibagrus guttatus]|uniref:ribonuclease H n=1 Tax=Hemibagrus guttatus TaxID=175788 RepID=A0AAE0QC82_9TELE|nr:hypothetical protein QTP70_016577 [Hemibagrus guttatus]